MDHYRTLVIVVLCTCASLAFCTPETDGATNASSDVRASEEHVKYPYYCARCSCTYINETLTTNCTNKGLYLRIHINTVELILQKIGLSRIKTYYFIGLTRLEILDLSHNRIASISSRAFRDLHSLKTLYLHSNSFTSLSFTLRPGVLSPLTNLTVLTLHNCIQRYVTDASAVESKLFVDLVSLEYLSIDGLYRIQFDEKFKQLQNLKTLVMSGEQGACRIKELTNSSFIGLENLENLYIIYCEVKSIDREAFMPLRSIRYLDLSRNTELEIARFGEAAYGLTFTNVSVIKINSIHNSLRAGTELLKEHMVYVRDLPLTELYMDENGIEYVDYEVFGNLPSSLKRISLRRNKMLFSIYLNILIFNNPNLEEIDATDQVVAYREYPSAINRQRYRDIYGRKKVAPSIAEAGAVLKAGGRHRRELATYTESVTLALQRLMCTGSMSNVQFPDFNATYNNISYMDFSRNFIPLLKGIEFLYLSDLKYLNLSGNYIELIIEESMLRDLVSLEILDLSNNILGNVLGADMFKFSYLGQLLHLNLSMNRVYQLGKMTFKGLHELKTLDMSENYLSDFDVDISDLDSLRKLDLSNNRIQSLGDSTRKIFDKMAKTSSFQVDLRGNVLSCNCNTIPFLRWLIESPVTFIEFEYYYCTLNDGSVRYLNASEILLFNLEEECRSYLLETVVGVTGGSFLVAFVMSYLIYRNRWKIRYLYYMAKVKIDGQKADHMDDHFDFDVFLSYADPDRGFVTNEMVRNLEKDKGVRLCIRDRNFEIGEVVAVNISKAIRTSKNTMLIVSRHFLKNKWCNFEMNMARMEAIHMKRKVLIVVFLEEIPANVLPLEMIDILREFPSTDVPDDEDLKPAFWQTCLGFFH